MAEESGVIATNGLDDRHEVMTESRDGIRKAAILIDSLDEPTAEVLLGQMPPELAVQVCAVRADLGDVAPGEREQVLAEFLEAGWPPAPGPLGQSPDRNADAIAEEPAAEPVLRLAAQSDRCSDVTPLPPSVQDPTAALASGLAQEDAQTICLVLTHLPPARAADLLRRLPAERQAEVLQRLAQRESPPPEIGCDRGEDPGILPFVPTDGKHVPTPPPINPCLEGRPLTSSREPRNGAMSREMEPADLPPLTDFDDLVRLEDAALARVFGAAAPQVVLLALSGANRELIERLVRYLPAAAGRTLRRQIATLGPTRLRDIELAQQQLVDLASQMCREGLIHVPSRRRFTMAA